MKNIKPASDVVCCVVDYGYFLGFSRDLAPQFKKLYYHTPIDTEFKDVTKCVIGDGVPEFERIDDLWEPGFIEEVDLFIFPDLDFGAVQRRLREMGKAVWGSMGASEIEMSRTGFLKMVEKLGLPTIPYKVITGLTALIEHLKSADDKWVKINRYRAQTETFYHMNYEQSQSKLDSLAVIFGGVKEHVVFVVQDHIKTEREIGYDGWTVDGQYPESSFAGYELKNELYLGSLWPYKELPKEVQEINSAMERVFKDYGYRGFFSSEIRPTEDGNAYFIDPTMRMAGLTMEHQGTNCENLGEVIWNGANGILIPPKFTHKFAAQATIHHDDHEDGLWKAFCMPEGAEKFIKLSNFCMVDGLYWFPPGATDEIGVVIGLGDTVEEAIANLMENFDTIEKQPVSIAADKFKELLESIEAAEAAGSKFSPDPIPSAEQLQKIL